MRMATRFVPTLAAVLVALTFTACASAPAKPIERRLAEYGLTATNALSTLQQQAVALNKGGLLPDAPALKTQEAIKLAAEQGQKLIPILRAMDLAGSTVNPAQVQSAREIIGQVVSTVVSATAAFGNTPAATQLQQLATAALNAYLTITLEIGKLSPAVPAAPPLPMPAPLQTPELFFPVR